MSVADPGSWLQASRNRLNLSSTAFASCGAALRACTSAADAILRPQRNIAFSFIFTFRCSPRRLPSRHEMRGVDRPPRAGSWTSCRPARTKSPPVYERIGVGPQRRCPSVRADGRRLTGGSKRRLSANAAPIRSSLGAPRARQPRGGHGTRDVVWGCTSGRSSSTGRSRSLRRHETVQRAVRKFRCIPHRNHLSPSSRRTAASIRGRTSKF